MVIQDAPDFSYILMFWRDVIAQLDSFKKKAAPEFQEQPLYLFGWK